MSPFWKYYMGITWTMSMCSSIYYNDTMTPLLACVDYNSHSRNICGNRNWNSFLTHAIWLVWKVDEICLEYGDVLEWNRLWDHNYCLSNPLVFSLLLWRKPETWIRWHILFPLEVLISHTSVLYTFKCSLGGRWFTKEIIDKSMDNGISDITIFQLTKS